MRTKNLSIYNLISCLFKDESHTVKYKILHVNSSHQTEGLHYKSCITCMFEHLLYCPIQLHDTYTKVCRKRQMAGVDYTEYQGIISLLETRGVIATKKIKDGRMAKVSNLSSLHRNYIQHIIELSVSHPIPWSYPYQAQFKKTKNKTNSRRWFHSQVLL